MYVDRAAERKAEYERNLKEQNDEAEDNVIFNLRVASITEFKISCLLKDCCDLIAGGRRKRGCEGG